MEAMVDGWFALEVAIVAAIAVTALLRVRLGRSFGFLITAGSGALLVVCVAQWISSGAGRWTLVFGALALAMFVYAIARSLGR